MKQVHFFDRKVLPTQTLNNAYIVRSSSALVQAELRAPRIEMFDAPQPLTRYPDGVDVTFYDENLVPSAHLSAGYAVSWDEAGITSARDSVVIIDFSSHDTIYLHDIVWNTKQQRVFSNNPVRSKNGDRVTLGDAFHSDDQFRNLQIINQRGTIAIRDDVQDTLAP